MPIWVLDLVGGDTLRASFRAIKPAGRVITIATSSESETDHKIKEAFFIVADNAGQLREISKLMDTGVLEPVVREVLPIAAAAQAYVPTKIKGHGKTGWIKCSVLPPTPQQYSTVVL